MLTLSTAGRVHPPILCILDTKLHLVTRHWYYWCFLTDLYTHIINMHIYTCTCRIHIDAIIKTSDTVLRKIYLSLYLKGLCVRGSWRPNRTAIYWPPLLWPSALCLSHFPGLLNWRPGGPLFAGCRLSLPHLVTNGSGLQTNWLPVSTELYNSSISHSILGMACLIVIKRK